MKQKILLASIVLFSVCSAKAQINKGTVWVGGSARYFKTDNEPEENTYSSRELGLDPGVGVAIKDNLIVGAELLYSGYKRTTGYQNGLYKVRNYGGGLFIRKYIPVVSRFYFFAQGSALAYATKSTDKDDADTETGKGWTGSLGLTPGIAFSVTKKIQLESALGNLLSLTYAKTDYRSEHEPARKSETFGGGISSDALSQLSLGIRFLL